MLVEMTATARSPRMKEKREGQMVLPQDEANIVPSLLAFLYAGHYDNPEHGIAMHHARLFSISDKYGISGLQDHAFIELRCYLHVCCSNAAADETDIADVLNTISYAAGYSPATEAIYNMMVRIPWRPAVMTNFKPL
jgi:hypothetical protein